MMWTAYTFFRWSNENLQAEPTSHRMLVHLFGAVSSPACVNIALRKSVEDHQHLYSPEVCQVTYGNSYVDDFLMSFDTDERVTPVAKRHSRYL